MRVFASTMSAFALLFILLVFGSGYGDAETEPQGKRDDSIHKEYCEQTLDLRFRESLRERSHRLYCWSGEGVRNRKRCS